MSICFQTNITVITLTACTILFTRSAGVAYFAVGAVSCSLSVKLLKRAIRQPRPSGPHQKKTSYGMPSTHSASITYFATYIPLACIYLPLHPSLPSNAPGIRILSSLVVLPWATCIVSSRVWLGHHSWPQVAVGASYGFAFALVWFNLWCVGLNKYGGVVESFLKINSISL
ncbi:hypothetical protein BDZ94DRAFT_1161591 [Collybia nuda]|uniref:Phosphatidic acid phosphatase type 2/haloperoxidase domain-containing protein n=1 Tax=Collybia nuda TaxID=64659 RepID=A0A9P5Y9D2_9AGAR|nr:hypothetical protein BDZ94DRAFT_1161591 [Collybia nuda]